jgi:hypothetical protein
VLNSVLRGLGPSSKLNSVLHISVFISLYENYQGFEPLFMFLEGVNRGMTPKLP